MKFFLDHKYLYPCQYCGECSIWLAYTYDVIDDNQLVKNCIQSKCPIYGEEVKNYE